MLHCKAFDSIKRAILGKKLISYGVSGKVGIVRILIFWYTTQHFNILVYYSKIYVRWKNIMSNTFSVTNGVRQGGILSPYLFCVYMDDLSNKLTNVNAGCIIDSSLINRLMYADDLVLMARSSMGLSMLLSVCSEYGIEHDIKYNSTKSNVMIFSCKKFKDIHIPNLLLNGETLPRVSKYKYLGHIITEDLCDNDYISRQYKRIYAQGNALIRKFYMCTESVKCTLFKSYCTSLYTCQLWFCYRAESTRKLCVAYNNVFRFVCNEPRDCSASYMFVSRGLPTCKMLNRSLLTCIAKSGNAILQSIVNSDALYNSPLCRHWRKMLYVYSY